MLYNPPIHLALGLTALLIGLLLVLSAPATNAEATMLGRLPSLSLAELESTAAGQTILVEGQVDPTAPAILHDFVAFSREEYRSRLIGESAHWVEAERTTPPFTLRLPDGAIPVLNADYDFPMVIDAVQEAEPTATRGAVRVRGLRRGAPVFAVGTVAQGLGGWGLQAHEVYPGTRRQFVADAQRWASTERRIGLGASLLGLAELALSGWQLRRFLRELRTAPTVD